MKEKINILLLGGGGREAAIGRKLAASPRTEQLYVTTGNAVADGERVELNPSDFEAVEHFVNDHGIDMIVVGPEQPLVDGIYDHFESHPVKVIGPSRDAARLEGSKEFAKEFMFRHGIPTARFMTVTEETLDEGISFLRSLKPPYVLKADGLAGGKGVLIIDSIEEAEESLRNMLGGMFGEASSTVVIEEFLNGIECSAFVVTDGEDYRMLPVAKDYKRVDEGDKGPNTGGMGAVSPVPFADDAFMEKIEQRIVRPTLRGLQEEGLIYGGFIFLGLMNVDGEPMVIEYNVRMGDPETEVVMPRLKSDLVDLLEGVADHTLGLKKTETDPQAAVTVMLVSGGYPGSYGKGKVISGLDKISPDVTAYHAGTKLDSDGRIVTNGGRVVALTARGADIHEAAAKAKEAARMVDFEGKHFRSDIADDL